MRVEFWIAALGLMLVLEGIMPFMFPAPWRATLRKISGFRDGQVRFIGLSAMLTGFLVVYLVGQ
jgi:uncharacterized protein YjeT (DUF2065 family)